MKSNVGLVLGAVALLVAAEDVQATKSFPNPSPEGNSWAPCGYAAEQLAAEGNGSTYGSCLGCSPTSFTCPSKCQSLIDALYEQCDGVYTPQDQYFDPAKTLSGYWNDHIDTLRVMTARCGCSGTEKTAEAMLIWRAVAVATAVAWLARP